MADTIRTSEDGPFTIHEYARLPIEYQKGTELVRGWIVREPPPAWPHARVHAKLTYYLVEFVDRTAFGVVLVEGGFVTEEDPPTVRGPDVSFVAYGRLREPRYGEPYMRPAPDLAVEILSPSNRPGNMRRKVAEYFAAGSRMVWLIDPRKKSATVYEPAREYVIPPDGALCGGNVVPGFELPLAKLFAL